MFGSKYEHHHESPSDCVWVKGVSDRVALAGVPDFFCNVNILLIIHLLDCKILTPGSGRCLSGMETGPGGLGTAGGLPGE